MLIIVVIPVRFHMKKSICKTLLNFINMRRKLRSVGLTTRLNKVSCRCIPKKPGFSTNRYAGTLMYHSSVTVSM